MTNFDPNAAAADDAGIFGLPYSYEESKLIFLPVPWEATTSYGGGTSCGPKAILQASHQVDLFDLELKRFYESGLFIMPESQKLADLNRQAKNWAKEGKVQQVNEAGETLNRLVYEATQKILNDHKIAAVIGGDHSTPFGALQAVAEKHPEFGILHFDAHSDTRRAYQGFTWSHASILYNVMQNIPQVTKLVQVGIRDFCEEEFDYTRSLGDRAHVFFDVKLTEQKMQGVTWQKLVEQIVAPLPQKVWITFDIDGLDPRFCPHTGTPVPGGLDFYEAVTVIKTLARSGRHIIGFDLNEVAPAPGFPDSPDEWDANVGARLLYQLAGWTLQSHKEYPSPGLRPPSPRGGRVG